MPALPPLRRQGSNTVLPRPSLTAQTMAAVRRRFLDEGVAPEDLVPASILRSWQRCAALGLDMAQRPQIEPIGRAELCERHERAERLRAAARTEIEALHGDACAAGGIVILTDADGLVLDTLGSSDFASKAARVALRPGVAWRESATGTNAIGAALAERDGISVIGGEHFFESHRILSCTAAPILGPRGETVGVLDLSNRAEVQQTHALALVRRAIETIEHRLFDGHAGAFDVVRLHADPSELGGPREGLLAFEGDRLVAANRHGLAFMELEWDALGATRWADIFACARTRAGEIGRLKSSRGRLLYGRLQSPTTIAARPSPARKTPIAPPSAPAPVVCAETRPKGEVEPIWDDGLAVALSRATRLIDAEVPVLIQGETGVGKEVFARALHAACRRRAAPFVAVNCAALPEGLIEAELFGYDEGAFTGARKQGSKGLMREADGGVLFLDEIGDMPMALQARLLRALQQREVAPLGGGRPVPVDFALVCATHHGLGAAVAARTFREDLYFRIAQYTVDLEPLRRHPDRRGVIARLWTRLGAEAFGVTLAPAALDGLAAYDWPGNFRQLTATLRTLMILAEPGEALPFDALPADIRRAVATTAVAAPQANAPGGGLEAITRSAMRAALDAAGGNISRAASQLGIHRSTFYRRLFDDDAH